MADRSVSPSPNKSQNLERGVFSSISGISLYKSLIDERKQLQSNSLLQIKSPKVKSSLSSRFVPSQNLTNRSKSPEIRSKAKPEEDPSKLQETIRRLSIQLGKEKKANEKLEQTLKDTTQSLKNELNSALTNNDKLQKSMYNYKSLLTSTSFERDQLLETLKKTEASLKVCQDELLSVTSLLVSEISQFSSEMHENMKENILKHLKSSMGRCKINMNEIIGDVEKWEIRRNEFDIKDELAYSVEYFEQGTDSLASTRGFNNIGMDEFQNAIALYDFDKEREEDLEFSRGDLIEVLEKNESGWWIGRFGDKIGTFPFNFVNII